MGGPLNTAPSTTFVHETNRRSYSALRQSEQGIMPLRYLNGGSVNASWFRLLLVPKLIPLLGVAVGMEVSLVHDISEFLSDCGVWTADYGLLRPSLF